MSTTFNDLFGIKPGVDPVGAKVSGTINISLFTKILEKKIAVNVNDAKAKADAALVLADYNDALVLLHSLYSLYPCPDKKADWKTKKDSWIVPEEAKNSIPQKKMAKYESQLDAVFVKLKVSGRITNLAWARALHPIVCANEGFYDNCLIAGIPKHPNLLYSKGFWAALKINSALKLYETYTERSADLTKLFLNANREAAREDFKAMQALKTVWVVSDITTYQDKGTKSADIPKQYLAIMYHILDPRMLLLSHELSGALAGKGVLNPELQKEYTRVKDAITTFCTRWMPEGRTIKTFDKEGLKTYYEECCKPAQRLAAEVRRPIGYDPKKAKEANLGANVRSIFALPTEVVGTRKLD